MTAEDVFAAIVLLGIFGFLIASSLRFAAQVVATGIAWLRRHRPRRREPDHATLERIAKQMRRINGE